jgi:hypothetical protein
MEEIREEEVKGEGMEEEKKIEKVAEEIEKLMKEGRKKGRHTIGRTTVTISLPSPLYEVLSRYAWENGTNMAAVVRAALYLYFLQKRLLPEEVLEKIKAMIP